MKQGIHPDYHPVVFRDRAANFAFLTRSTATSERTITWEDGSTYPVVDVEISSASHPFYTGQARVLDTAGRVEQFRRRYGRNAKGAWQRQVSCGRRGPADSGAGRPVPASGTSALRMDAATRSRLSGSWNGGAEAPSVLGAVAVQYRRRLALSGGARVRT